MARLYELLNSDHPVIVTVHFLMRVQKTDTFRKRERDGETQKEATRERQRERQSERQRDRQSERQIGRAHV